MGVEFEENKGIPRINYAPQNRPSKLVRKVLDLGIAKTEMQANYILLGAAAVLFFVMIIVFAKSGPTKHPTPPRDVVDRALQATVERNQSNE